MNGSVVPNFQLPQLSIRAFKRLSEYIQTGYGIKMPPVKKTMVQARLQKRLRELKMKSFEDYCDYIFSPEGANELVHMVDAVTTNKTDFFREPRHFDYLTRMVLPELIRTRKAGIQKKLIVWSAGCSSGEEPYTLAMVLSEFAEKVADFQFRILATDICTEVLNHAKLGIYPEKKAVSIPIDLKKKYLLRSKDRTQKRVRIVPQLRAKVQFFKLNFMNNNFGIHEPIDIIFCRNVIIYFKKDTQEILLNKFANYLVSGGYIFLGHSETIAGLDVPFISVAPNIYKKNTTLQD